MRLTRYRCTVCSLLRLDLEDLVCTHHRAMAVTVEELRVDDPKEDKKVRMDFVHAR